MSRSFVEVKQRALSHLLHCDLPGKLVLQIGALIRKRRPYFRHGALACLGSATIAPAIAKV